MDNISLWLWLSQKDHISAKVKYKLLDDFGSVENIYNSRYEDLSDVEHLQPEAINDICDKGFDFEKLYERCRKENIRILCPDSPLYPEMLKKLTDYPFILYCKGQMLDLNKYLCMAVVGTRKLSAYGAECALNLSREMAERGAVTIRDKGDLVKSLKKQAKNADKIYLATDPDREGEAISWHLANLLEIDMNSKCRITFNEITKKSPFLH